MLRPFRNLFATRKAAWHPLFLNRERVQDSFSGLVSLVRESVIVSDQGLRGSGSSLGRTACDSKNSFHYF